MSINNFTASGNLGGDCEQLVTPNNKYIARFSLPVKQGFGEHEKTSWLSCKLFGGAAEKLPQYLTKGTKVVVSGEYVTEKWQGNDGIEHTQPTILVRSIEIMSSGQPSGNSGQFNQQQNSGHSSGQQGFSQGGFNQQRPQQQNTQQPMGHNNRPQNQSQPQYNNPPMDFDDD